MADDEYIEKISSKSSEILNLICEQYLKFQRKDILRDEYGNILFHSIHMLLKYQPIPIEIWKEFWDKIKDISHNENSFKNDFKIGQSSDSQNNGVKAFYPGRLFRSGSVTGVECDLNCLHCDRKYLYDMIPIDTEEKFQKTVQKLQNGGFKGMLISGGCDSSGNVPIMNIKNGLCKQKKVRNSPDSEYFYFNAHVNLIDDITLSQIHNFPIDSISFDIIHDQRVIDKIFRNNSTVERYWETYQKLQKTEIRTIPHILLGAHFGQIALEPDIIRKFLEFPPELLVFIALIPPDIGNGDDMDRKQKRSFCEPDPGLAALIVMLAQILLPETEIAIGCMRPRSQYFRNFDKWSYFAGATRFVLPSRILIDYWNKAGVVQKKFGSCCLVENEHLFLMQLE